MQTSLLLGLNDRFRIGAESIAERKGQETIAVVRRLQTEHRRIIEKRAAEADIYVETMENLLRELRQRIMRWPVV